MPHPTEYSQGSRSWTTRRDEKKRRLQRVSSWMHGPLLPREKLERLGSKTQMAGLDYSWSNQPIGTHAQALIQPSRYGPNYLLGLCWRITNISLPIILRGIELDRRRFTEGIGRSASKNSPINLFVSVGRLRPRTHFHGLARPPRRLRLPGYVHMHAAR